MIHYQISIENPHRHFISFEAKFPCQGKQKLLLCLAAWRPGRYELGNFSKNIRKWKAVGQDRELTFRKITKDCWEVNCEGLDEVILTYEYYAAELNAGSTYLDTEQLYINPVNCFFYVQDSPQWPYQLQFNLPNDYQIASGLSKISKHICTASSYDDLADCPLIASDTIKNLSYSAHGILFQIWIQGDLKTDEERLIREFTAFTNAHFDIFGNIPCDEYHFLLHFPPYFIRHGVEHHNSTVIAMGPAADFQGESQFKDLLAISCHELFHTWNVKCIRPVEMMPYDFSQENYSRLGYVYEGVTTYYGDQLLWRCGSINDAEWFAELEDRIQTYMDNHGRFNLSVADSSFDTWLDGYNSGIPWRKVSIYNEGLLIACMCDLEILKASSGRYSLDDVMRDLYRDFGQKQIGYSESDYQNLIRKYLGKTTDDIFNSFVNGTEDYLPGIQKALAYAGLQVMQLASPKVSEANYGFAVDESGGKLTINSVIPCSPADECGLWIGDEIIAVNGTSPYKNFQPLLKQSETRPEIQFLRKGKTMSAVLNISKNTWGRRYKLMMNETCTEDERAFFALWKSNRLMK
ncbi:MAG: PDZ domain-containing protein [Flavobacteriales bacterium]|nr:PDZ domain-containing protein [Flavobacteriales bacterium]